MKVICAGYWKTGTKSLAEALRILGYNVYDFDDQIFELGDLWDKFFDGTVTDEDIFTSLKDVDAMSDGHIVPFWEEIHRVFPDAKIVFTTRDEDSWFKSYWGMHGRIPPKLFTQFVLAMFFPKGYQYYKRELRLIRYHEGIEGINSLHVRLSDKPRLYKLKFRKHNSHVLHRAPKDKLLIHNPKDGWNDLCDFLGKDIPNEPYPFVNRKSLHPLLEDIPHNPQMQQLLRETEIAIYVVIVAFVTLLIIIALRIF